MRSRFRPSHATVVAYVALFVALGGTAVAANGGNFILGQSNTAGAPTQLTSPTTNSAGALKVTSTATSGGRAIQGTSAHGQGIYGHSGSNAGVVGDSGTFDGVFGVSHGSGAGVSGHNDTGGGYGVFGEATGGWAIGAAGNATQARARGGFVKAMAFINPSGGGDAIRQCFNSQLPPSQATSLNCGMTYTPGNGAVGSHDIINFGFPVNDRFFSVTEGASQGVTLTVFPDPSHANAVFVSPIGNNGGNLSGNNWYWIIVY